MFLKRDQSLCTKNGYRSRLKSLNKARDSEGGVLALRPYNEHENLHYDNEYEYSYELPKPRGK